MAGLGLDEIQFCSNLKIEGIGPILRHYSNCLCSKWLSDADYVAQDGESGWGFFFNPFHFEVEKMILTRTWMTSKHVILSLLSSTIYFP